MPISISSEKNSEEPFPELSGAIQTLLQTGRELHDVMDDQISAIIASNNHRVEELAAKYATLRGRFGHQEQQFIKILSHTLQEAGHREDPVKLESLKKAAPESTAVIQAWKMVLSQTARQLKKKHEQLIDLLDFALSRNTNMMQSIYQMFNSKNTRYGSNGGRAGMAPGITINQEV